MSRPRAGEAYLGRNETMALEFVVNICVSVLIVDPTRGTSQIAPSPPEHSRGSDAALDTPKDLPSGSQRGHASVEQ